VADIAIPGEQSRVPARLYQPVGAPPFPVIVFAHGGGWTFGSLDSHDGLCRHLTRQSGCAVLAVDYRLAPEHPFPAPNDDVVRALRFVRSGGLSRLVDPHAIGAAGDSSGANLVLSALISLRDTDEAAVSAAALIYGCYAPDFETESQKRHGDGSLPLTTEGLRWFWGNFLGAAAKNPDPLAAPLAADLAGLPPLYLNAAGLDPLLDDTLQLSRRLAAAGVSHRFDFFPGVTHGFLRMGKRLNAARVGTQRIASFFAERLRQSEATA
jgi:acetyl esterase